MALSNADLQSIMVLLNEGLGPITKEIQAMKSEMATKEELKNLATKEDLKGLATKEDVENVFNELLKTEAWTGRIENRVDELTNKVDTLLLQSDNTALLLKLMNQQADEVNSIRSRVEVLEMKLA